MGNKDTNNNNNKATIPILSEPRWMESNLDPKNNSTKSNYRCRNFEKNYKCNYGISCKYYHVAPFIKSNSHQQIIKQNKNENLIKQVVLKDYLYFKNKLLGKVKYGIQLHIVNLLIVLYIIHNWVIIMFFPK